MDYKEQINQYFKRFKPSERTTQLYNMIVRDMGHKYRNYIDQGYTKEETKEKIAYEISNLRGHYPTLNSLERRPVKGGDPDKTMGYVFIVLYLIVSVGLYIWVPILVFIPQVFMGLFVLENTRTTNDKELHNSRRKLFVYLSLLLLAQAIGMIVRYYRYNILFPSLIVYALIYLSFGFTYLMLRGHQREMPDLNFVQRLLVGPNIIRNVNTKLYVTYLVCSLFMFLGHFGLVFIMNMFESW